MHWAEFWHIFFWGHTGFFIKSGRDVYGIQKFVSSWGAFLLPIFLILSGLLILFAHRLKFASVKVGSTFCLKLRNGFLGAFLMGVVFALALCPSSAVLYFGILVPMSAKASVIGYILPAVFALATALPVLLASWLLALEKSGNCTIQWRSLKFTLGNLLGCCSLLSERIAFFNGGCYMLEFFTNLADWFILQMNLSRETRLGESVHFFIEDSTKIFFLLYVLIFVISLFRAQLNPEMVRGYLTGKSRWAGYLLAVFLGTVTPFCSCSSIPMFMGFVAAGVPFGVSVAFLVSSPLISEIAAIMLLGMGTFGAYIVLIYILTGAIISIFAGYLSDKFNLERLLALKIPPTSISSHSCSSVKEKTVALLKYANSYAFSTVKSLAIYILLGLLVGAFMHGYIPQEFFVKYLGADNILAVPAAVIAGIPMYASQAGIVPLVQVLLEKGVPIGTALAAFMSIATISLPEMMMLKKIFGIKLLALFIIYLACAFILTGYLINFLFFF